MRFSALMDSGSERCFASPALARSLCSDLSSAPSAVLGLGGDSRRVHFVTVSIQHYASFLDNDDTSLSEWHADVAFLSNWEPTWAILLGRDGFFDQFTVTMHGAVPAVVLEPGRPSTSASVSKSRRPTRPTTVPRRLVVTPDN
jgi:hypothetical protein